MRRAWQIGRPEPSPLSFPQMCFLRLGYQDVCSLGSEARKDSLTSSLGSCLPRDKNGSCGRVGSVGWSGPGWHGRGGSIGHLNPSSQPGGQSCQEEHSLVGSPSKMPSQLRQEDSAILEKMGRISLCVFPEKSNPLFLCLLRSLNMADVS